MWTLNNTEGRTFHGLGSTSFIKREPHWPFIRSFVSQRRNSISKGTIEFQDKISLKMYGPYRENLPVIAQENL